MPSPLTTDRRTGGSFRLIFVLLAAGLVTSGWLYYRANAQQLRQAVEKELLAIAQFKADQLVQWRAERLALTRLFHTQRRIGYRVFQRRWSVVARCFSPRTEFTVVSERGLKPRATTWAPERELSGLSGVSPLEQRRDASATWPDLSPIPD